MQRWLCNTLASLLWVLGVSRELLAQRLSHHGQVNALLGRQKEESPHQCVAPNLITTSTSSRKIRRLSYEYVLWGPCEQFDRGSQGKKRRVSFYRIHVFTLKQESASFSQNRLYFFLSATGCIQTFSEYNQQRVYKAFAWLSYQFLSRRVVSCFPSRLLEALSPVKAVLALHDSWILHN